MKRVGKSVEFIVILIAVAVFITAFFGIYTHYGDITTTVISGAKDTTFGLEFDTQANMILKPAGEDELTEQQLLEAKGVLEERFKELVVPEYEMFVDVENQRIVVSGAWNEHSAYYPSSIISLVGTVGKLEVRMGNERDEEGNPTGITEEVILTNEHVKKATPDVSNTIDASISYFNSYVIRLELTGQGKKLMKEAMAELGEDAHISVWIDGALEVGIQVKNIADPGELVMIGSYDQNSIYEKSLILNTDPLPVAFSSELVTYTAQPGYGGDVVLTLMISAVVAIGLIVLVLILRYRMFGITALFALLGFGGGMMAVVTGYFGESRARYFTTAAAAAFILMMLVSVYILVRDGESMRNELRKSGSASSALFGAVGNNTWSAVKIYSVTAAVGILILSVFNSYDSVFKTILSPLTSLIGYSNNATFQYFGQLILAGSLLGIAFVVLGQRLMTRSIISFNKLNNPVWFGGQEDEAE